MNPVHTGLFVTFKAHRQNPGKMKAFFNAIIHTGSTMLHNHCLLVENGIIKGLEKEIPDGALPVDLQGRHVAAGLIDMQINGGHERYFAETPDAETLNDMYQSSAAEGAAWIFPCLISSPFNNMLQAIEAVQTFQRKERGVCGIHLEGPYINPEKRGAHPLSHLRPPQTKELEMIIERLNGLPAIMTIAPELFTHAQLDLLLRAGVQLSIGHSMLGYEEAMRCFDRGIQLVTHLYNAMPAFHHRAPGLIGAALDHINVYTPLVLDGAHCHYAAARLAWQLKKEKTLLISDGSFLGRQKKEFQWGDFNMQLRDGYYRNEAGDLAGSAISMKDAVHNAIHEVGIAAEEAVKAASTRVADALRLNSIFGRIENGYPARFIVFDTGFVHPQTLIAD
jgi:N-acetylglucosamine-6-phosphate deacetylase